MSEFELAFNVGGDPFVPASHVTRWRVRRMRPRGERGAPELVYDRETGRPLTLPVDARMDDLRRAVEPGRYRLDPIDAAGLVDENADPAYVEVIRQRNTSHHEPSLRPLEASYGSETPSEKVEAMRLTVRLAESVVMKFPEMMAAAAGLLRAADGAGLPARTPPPTTEADIANPEQPVPASPLYSVLENLIGQLAPMLGRSLASKLSGLDPMMLLDWSRAAGKATGHSSAAPSLPIGAGNSVPSDSYGGSTSEPAVATPQVDPAAQGQLLQILAELTPDEAARAQQLAGALTPAERGTWINELLSLSVADATKRVRVVIAKEAT